MTSLLIACEVMKEELLRIQGSSSLRVSFVSMGLHATPAKLHVALQQLLVDAKDVDQVVLGFGLCGNATEGLMCPHAPLIIPRVHDCIPLLQGERRADGPQLDKGVFYLSGGWMEGERTIVSEHRRATAKFGPKKALRVLQTMFSAYHELRFIQTDHPRLLSLQNEAQDLSDLLNLRLDVVPSNSGYLERLVNGPWEKTDFISVPIGDPVKAQYFSVNDGAISASSEQSRSSAVAVRHDTDESSSALGSP